MASKKISALQDGGNAQASDEFLVARAGDNFRVNGSALGTAIGIADATALETKADAQAKADAAKTTAIGAAAGLALVLGG